MVDNIVEEIHAIREKIYEECGGDSEKLAAYYLKLQEESENITDTASEAPQRTNTEKPLGQ